MTRQKRPDPPPPGSTGGSNLGDAISPPVSAPAARTGNPAWDRPVTPRQLATFLQVSPRTLVRLAKRRDFPRLDVAGQTRFIPNDVIAYLRRK